tara:strand:+ start:483 stop:731 length:249 start_codon:yes stop_codon:yes gene_type:complete
MVNGSVTISIEDFQALLDTKIKTDEVEGKLKIAIKELQVFLSFICSREDISKHIDEFNRQSQTSSIIIDGGKAVIKLNEEKS